MDGASGREAELGHTAIASAAGSQQAIHHCAARLPHGGGRYDDRECRLLTVCAKDADQ